MLAWPTLVELEPVLLPLPADAPCPPPPDDASGALTAGPPTLTFAPVPFGPLTEATPVLGAGLPIVAVAAGVPDGPFAWAVTPAGALTAGPPTLTLAAVPAALTEAMPMLGFGLPMVAVVVPAGAGAVAVAFAPAGALTLRPATLTLAATP